jgi:hypothetical protein
LGSEGHLAVEVEDFVSISTNVRNFKIHPHGLIIMQEDTGRREKRCGGKDRTEKSVVYSIVVSHIN